MKFNAAGLALLKKFEGCLLHAYQDSVGVWTIGWGHTGQGVKPGQTISQHQADIILQSDIEKFEEGVDNLCAGLQITDNQFSAMVCLAFNIGITRFASSTLLKRLRHGDTAGAAEQFDRWVLAGGHKLEGLVKRRAAEKELFLT